LDGKTATRHPFYTPEMLAKYKAYTGSVQAFEHHPVLCVGDVVVFQLDSTRPVMVSRIAAGPHQDMLSTDPTDKPFKVPAFHFWVRGPPPTAPFLLHSNARAVIYTLVVGTLPSAITRGSFHTIRATSYTRSGHWQRKESREPYA
jgi:hypothetical protein